MSPENIQHIQEMLGRSLVFAGLGAVGFVLICALTMRSRTKELSTVGRWLVTALGGLSLLLMTFGTLFLVGIGVVVAAFLVIPPSWRTAQYTKEVTSILGVTLGLFAWYIALQIDLNIGRRLAGLDWQPIDWVVPRLLGGRPRAFGDHAP